MVGSLGRSSRAGLALVALVVVMLGCGGPGPTPPDTDGGDGLDLAGPWTLAGAGPNFSVDGVMTLDFGGSSSGLVRFIGRSDASGVTTCRTYAFALIDDALLLVQSSIHGSEAFVVTAVSEDRLTFVSDVSDFELTRVTGEVPVADCGGAHLETVATIEGRPSSVGSLVGTGARLYYNRRASPNALTGYDLATNSVLADRVFTQSVGGGIDRYVMAALDDDVFYGQCWCGSVQRFSAFNATTDTHLVQVDSNTDLGHPTTMRIGAFDASAGRVWLGGRDATASDVNRLFLLDPVTLALDSQRTILRRASIADIAIVDDVMYALLAADYAIVAIGSDGRATATWSVPRSTVRGILQGLAAADGSLYVMIDDAQGGETILAAVTLE